MGSQDLALPSLPAHTTKTLTLIETLTHLCDMKQRLDRHDAFAETGETRVSASRSRGPTRGSMWVHADTVEALHSPLESSTQKKNMTPDGDIKLNVRVWRNQTFNVALSHT